MILIEFLLQQHNRSSTFLSQVSVSRNFRFSNLAVFGGTSIPIENPLLPRIVDESDDDNESNQPQIPINGVMYNIRDKDLICSLTLISQGETLHPGSFLTVSLRFGKSAQPCRSIRAYLQLCENRIDGSRVQVRMKSVIVLTVTIDECVDTEVSNTYYQEKILVEANRSADGAELIYLRLHFPDNMACSFVSPLFKVSRSDIIDHYFLSNSDIIVIMSSHLTSTVCQFRSATKSLLSFILMALKDALATSVLLSLLRNRSRLPVLIHLSIRETIRKGWILSPGICR